MRYKKQTAVTCREQKALPFREFKIVDEEQGIFEGYLSIFGVADQGDDVVTKGAFTKTLRESKERQSKNGSRYLFPILWMHDENQPVGGFLTAVEDEKGLFVRGELDLDTQIGREKYSGLKKGYVDGMSIGYAALQRSYKDGFRYLKEVRLYEGSLIVQGGAMMLDAVVTSVKSGNASDEGDLMNRQQRRARKAANDFNAAYGTAQNDLQEKWHDANVALVQTIFALMQDDTETDKGAAVGEAIDQFKAVAVDLAEQSAAAAFSPCLDWDDDSFADSMGNNVFGVDTDDSDSYYGRMSAERSDLETKVGAAMSKTNHEAMGKALKQVKAGYSQLTILHKSLSPTERDYQENALGAVNDPGKKARAGADEERSATHDEAFSTALANFAQSMRA